MVGVNQDVVPVKQVWKYIYPDLVTDKVGLTHEVINLGIGRISGLYDIWFPVEYLRWFDDKNQDKENLI